jgi:glycosyltransferase involved in cell wall biosynthesis
LGRLVHQKGLDVLLAALPTVLAARGIELEIAGDGELRDELERAATGLPVTFRGRIDGPSAVADYLRSLDVYIMPSRYEGLPNAMLEALSCGVRVVATEAPGMAEATRGAVRLVPPDDPEALAQAILHTLEQPATTSRPEWPSFEQAAVAHRSVFEHALVRRRRLAGAGRARRALDDPTSVPSGSLLRREILDR